MQIYWNTLINVVITIIFYLLAVWTIMGYIQHIKKIEKEVIDLNLNIKYLYHKHDELQKELNDFKAELGYEKFGLAFTLPEYASNMMLKRPAKNKHVKEIFDILKEAGIIIEPPKNIEVPDPRGYSVKKVK